jgi:hypothetical protein
MYNIYRDWNLIYCNGRSPYENRKTQEYDRDVRDSSNMSSRLLFIDDQNVRDSSKTNNLNLMLEIGISTLSARSSYERSPSSYKRIPSYLASFKMPRYVKIIFLKKIKIKNINK